MGYMPIMALLTVTYASFFRAGKDGIGSSNAYARRLLVPAAAYGALAGVAIFVLAPLLPSILGDDYRESVEALRWLSPMPLLAALCYLPADALTGADEQGKRTVIQLLAAAFNIMLNLVLVPAYSWRGAAWATLATLALLAASLWLTAVRLERSSRTSVARTVGEAS
jgi:O-antigen/teichoic acid export membrane protein